VRQLNPMAARLLSLDLDSTRGQALESLSGLTEVQDVAVRASTTGEPVPGLEFERALSGMPRTLRCGALPGIQAGAAVVFIQDVTAQKCLKDHVRKVDSLATLGMIAGTLTHIIHSPVNLAASYVNVLLKDPSDAARVKQYGERIQGSLKRASEASARLLWLAQGPEPTTDSCDLHAIVERACELLEKQLTLGSHELFLDLAAEVHETVGDPVMLELLFLGLIVHVIDLAGRPGQLLIASRHRPPMLEVTIRHDAVTEIPGQERGGAGASTATSTDFPALVIGRNFVERAGGAIDFAPDPEGRPTLVVLVPLLRTRQPVSLPDASS
ncbi:MAG: hypothetical protein HY815_25500, partial [Candidatus Riflebacteria bacterium]|nr:hypothetical protein [Candidatus Riflebacteria bacterium]